MVNNDKVKDALRDLFENKLNLKTNLKEYIQKIISPYTDLQDYVKYGDMFLKLEVKNETMENSTDKILTDEQVKELTWDNACYESKDSENLIFEVVNRVFSYYNLEKSYVDFDVIIKEISTGNFYKATLMKNYYHDNENIVWKRVYPHEVTTTIYTTQP